jgi:glycosyltransferase involved in cell wall biosynthesis
LRIAQIAPLTEAVPPKLYGGTERIVSFLTEELTQLGHEVTLFASADSITSARLVPMCERALRFGSNIKEPLALHLSMLERVLRRAGEFDILHFHLDYLPFIPFARQVRPCLTTQHGRLDIPEIWPLFRAHPWMSQVSISAAQRAPMPWANWAATIPHGLPERLLEPQDTRPSYLAFLGRISLEKCVDRAIEIAGRACMKIKIAAKVDRSDRDYFDEKIRPMLAQPHVEYIGEISDTEKATFLSGAHALLFPIDWPEPFGLVMIEAMACGVPVVAYPHGSVPEVIEDGRTGFLVDSIEGAVRAVDRLPSLARAAVRARFEERFTARRMAADYSVLYARLVQEPMLQVPNMVAE